MECTGVRSRESHDNGDGHDGHDGHDGREMVSFPRIIPVTQYTKRVLGFGTTNPNHLIPPVSHLRLISLEWDYGIRLIVSLLPSLLEKYVLLLPSEPC